MKKSTKNPEQKGNELQNIDCEYIKNYKGTSENTLKLISNTVHLILTTIIIIVIIYFFHDTISNIDTLLFLLIGMFCKK